jgi:hypothetical protein
MSDNKTFTIATLKSEINADDMARRFSERIDCKTAVKQLFRDLGHSKEIEELVMTCDYGKKVMDAAGEKIAPFIEATQKTISDYVNQNNIWVKQEAAPRNYDARMDFFKDKLEENINVIGKERGNDLFTSVIDIAKEMTETKSVQAKCFPNGVDTPEEMAKWNHIVVNLVERAITRQLIIAAVNYTAVDTKTGEKVDVEVVDPKTEAHHQDETKTDGDKKPVIIDTTATNAPKDSKEEKVNEPKTEEPKAEEPKKSVDKYELAENTLKQSKDEQEMVSAIAKLIEGIDDKTPQDIVDRVAGIIKPYYIKVVKLMSTDSKKFIGGKIANLSDKQMFAIDFYWGVLKSLLPIPHKEVSGIDVDEIAKIYAVNMKNIDVNETEYDAMVSGFVSNAAGMYLTISPVVTDSSTDLIRFVRFVVMAKGFTNIHDINGQISEADATKLLGDDIMNVLLDNIEDVRKRVNAALWTKDTRGYEIGRHLTDGMAERQANQFFNDGLEVLRKAMKEASAA